MSGRPPKSSLKTLRSAAKLSPKKLSGSYTHGSLTKEPPLVRLKAKPSDIKYGLPAKLPKRPKHIVDTDMKDIKRGKTQTPAQKFFSEPIEASPEKPSLNQKIEKAKSGKWIQGAIKHPGALHKTLKVPMGEKIPVQKIEKAEKSSNPLTRKRADLAMTLKGFKHKK